MSICLTRILKLSATTTRLFHFDNFISVEQPYERICASIDQCVEGSMVQHSFHYLSMEQREFIINGTMPVSGEKGNTRESN